MKNKFTDNYSGNSSSIHSPRFSIYHANGSGRDSYIYTNNGGASKVPIRFNLPSENGPFNFTRYYNLR